MMTVIRSIIGGASLLLFANQFVSVKKLSFDHHYHPQEDTVIDYRQGNILITLKYFQHVLNKYEGPKAGQLVLFQMPDRNTKFLVVEASPKTYFYDQQSSADYYIPNGFVALIDPQTKQTRIECIGSVRGKSHLLLF